MRLPYASIAVLSVLVCLPGLAQQAVLLEAGSPMTYQANSANPGMGLAWTLPAFDDASWPAGVYGVGFELGSGAENLIQTPVPGGTFSVYTRATFNIADVNDVQALFLGADYDDGYVAWINGVEVYRAPEMPPGIPKWNTLAASHESSNGPFPVYDQQDISTTGIPALQNGQNVVAIGVYNFAGSSSDLVLVPQLTVNTAFTLVRGPYLQSGSDSEVTVRWRTTDTVESRVDYGLTPLALTSSVVDPTLTTDHEVVLPGLTADQTYYYAVGDAISLLVGGDDDHFFVTAPPPGTSKPTRLWVLGDSGTANQDARNVRDAYYAFTDTLHTDLWLMLGDNAYPDGTDSEYQAAVFDMYPEMLRKSVLWPTLGNHDGHSTDSSQQTGPYYDIFTLPSAGQAGGLSSGTEAYYSFDYGNIHFVVLESFQTDRSVGGAMLTWLAADLAVNTADWTIAFWHHPPYTKGSHDSDTEPELIEIRENALPILEAHGVDLVLTGHSHSYERSFLIDGHYGDSTTFGPSVQVDAGDGDPAGDGAYVKSGPGPVTHQGAVYAVAGSSGKTAPVALDHPAMVVNFAVLGSMVLDFDNDRLDATFLDDNGTTLDEFTILKNTCNDPDADGVCTPGDNCPLDPNPLQEDADLDGAGDACDVCPFDPLDDVDVDGVCGDVDNCPDDPNPGQEDGDGDGIGDVCDCSPAPTGIGDTLRLDKGLLADCDNDPGTPDARCIAIGWDAVPGVTAYNAYRGYRTHGDPWAFNQQCLESDISGLSTSEPLQPLRSSVFYYQVASRCPNGSSESVVPGPPPIACPDSNMDPDGDGTDEAIDNCPGLVNSSQADLDGDSRGDACDNCPAIANTAQENLDLDGMGNLCDPDADGDGVAEDGDGSGTPGDAPCPDQVTANCDDNCPNDFNPDQFDSDGDGIGDACD